MNPYQWKLVVRFMRLVLIYMISGNFMARSVAMKDANELYDELDKVLE